MAVDQTLGTLAARAAEAGFGANATGGGAGAGKPPAASFEHYLQPHSPQSAGAPPAPPVEGEPPAMLRPTPLEEVERPRADTLGHDVLDTLERFGDRVNSLRHMGGQWRRGAGAGDGAGGGASALGLPANVVRAPASSAAADPMADVSRQYRDTFAEAMSHQAELFDLVVEVDLGRQVSSTTTSTAKTLLTQSG